MKPQFIFILRKFFVDTIEIELKAITGRSIVFKGSKTFVLLSFCRKKIYKLKMHTSLPIILVLSLEKMHLNAKDCESYCCAQIGGDNYFDGIAHQGGHGYFRDIRWRISPYLFHADRYLGRQLFQTRKNLITDVALGSSFRDSARNRLREASKKIKNDIFEKLQHGKGIKRKRRRNQNQSKAKLCKTTYNDIFT